VFYVVSRWLAEKLQRRPRSVPQPAE
jgi:hypothetical protein